MNLSGKTALITGASRRIGRATALALAEKGCNIILHYHNSAEEAQQLAEDIKRSGRLCRISKHNLEHSAETREWINSLIEESPGIDILVNSASSYLDDRYSNLGENKLGRSMAIHLLSPVAMITALHGNGRPCSVINILDTRASGSDPAHVSYHIGKSALLKSTLEMAAEMAPLVRINGVAPGIILPPEGKGDSWFRKLENTYPLDRRGRVEDVTDAVLYLCTAEFVTGQILYVDGGRHLKGFRNEL